jgi:transcription initiation factor TFIIF subunit beta
MTIHVCQAQDKKSTPVKPSDMKRTRRDPAELQNILFKLFERQPNWSLKQLMQETDQPEVFSSLPLVLPKRSISFITITKYLILKSLLINCFCWISVQQFLKEMLNNLCVYNKRGPNQGTHELKLEYKKFTDDDNAT